ncbi:MAG: hypothetical protein ACE5ID_09490 [Acidobacteriota bacterium]
MVHAPRAPQSHGEAAGQTGIYGISHRIFIHGASISAAVNALGDAGTA